MSAIQGAKPAKSSSKTIDEDEIRHFAKDSDNWWDENGPFKPLHWANPTRISYIKQQICEHFDRETDGLKSLKDLSILDIGCGGGLACEPLARLGANVTGADADTNAIRAAKTHANQVGLDIEYLNEDAENIGKKFDVVLALEVIEHVSDINAFVRIVKNAVKPDGLVIFSTLNRTPKSFALGIIGLEYVLGWVPRGTHHWKKFVKPSELSRAARQESLTPHDVCGIVYNPIKNDFTLSENDLDVNYLMTFKVKG